MTPLFFDKRSKFFHYLPKQLIINNIEFDHADIFNSLDEIIRSFSYLIRLVPRNGIILANGDDPNVKLVIEKVWSPCKTFGLSESCDFRVDDINSDESGTNFCLKSKSEEIFSFHIPLWGNHNVFNASAVAILSLENGITKNQIQNAFAQFKSIKRRLELRGEVHGIKVYDDFAHHPTAIEETIRAIKQKHPDQKCVAIFEPRSNTSVLNVHQKELISSFSEADTVILSYPHRIDRIPPSQCLDVKEVVTYLKNSGKTARAFDTVDDIISFTSDIVQPGDVVLIMSNGKFDNIHQRMLNQFQKTIYCHSRKPT